MTREDAIGVIKGSMPTLWKETRDAIQTLIPELAESDDERIEKELVQFLSDIKSISESGRTEWAVRKEDAELCKAAIAYLEKQKEQKPAECIEDSVKFKEGFKAGRESGLCDGQKYVLDNLGSYGLCKSAEWSEEDKRKLNMLYSVVSQAADAHAFFTTTRLISDRDAIELHDFLKSLRPQLRWKPSAEQMTVFENALVELFYWHSREDVLPLKNLFEDLKKL